MALCSCLALCSIACSRPAGSKLARSAKTRSILPKAAVSPFVMHATRNQRFAIACYHRSMSLQSTVSTTALTVASSTRSASASSAATALR